MKEAETDTMAAARDVVDAQRIISGISVVMDLRVRATHATDLPALGIAIAQLQRERWRLSRYAREGEFFLARFDRSWMIEGPAPGGGIPVDTAQVGLFPPGAPAAEGLPTHVHRFGEDDRCLDCGDPRELPAVAPPAVEPAQEAGGPTATRDGPEPPKKPRRRGRARPKGMP